MFKTQYDSRARFYTSIGNPIVETYTGRYDKNGSTRNISINTLRLRQNRNIAIGKTAQDIIHITCSGFRLNLIVKIF